MSATLGRVISDYRGIVQPASSVPLNLKSRDWKLTDWQASREGYSAKLLGNTDDEKRKRMWPIGLEAIPRHARAEILLIEDQAATARTLALRKPVSGCNQRSATKTIRNHH